MADEQTPAEVQDTSEPTQVVDTPQERADAQQEVDWQKRYTDLHPEYTRATQEAAQLRQERELYHQMVTSDDPDARREAAEALGFEYPDDSDPQGQQFVDEEARRAAFKAAQWVDQFEQQAQQYTADQAAIDHINQQFPAIERQLGRELTAEEAQVIGDLAMANRDENGVPTVEPYADLVLGVLKAEQERRPRPRAPHFSANGAEATKAPNLDDRQERLDWMASQLMANEP